MTSKVKVKLKANAYSSWQLASPLRKLKWHIGSHSVCYLFSKYRNFLSAMRRYDRDRLLYTHCTIRQCYTRAKTVQKTPTDLVGIQRWVD